MTNKLTLESLFASNQKLVLASVEREDTDDADGHEITILRIENMDHDHVLSITVTIPSEMANLYDLSC